MPTQVRRNHSARPRARRKLIAIAAITVAAGAIVSVNQVGAQSKGGFDLDAQIAEGALQSENRDAGQIESEPLVVSSDSNDEALRVSVGPAGADQAAAAPGNGKDNGNDKKKPSDKKGNGSDKSNNGKGPGTTEQQPDTTSPENDTTTSTAARQSTTVADETTTTQRSTTTQQTTTTQGPTTTERATTTTTRPTTTTTRPTTTTTQRPPGDDNRRSLHFYGMEWTSDPHPGDLETVRDLGVDTIMVDFDGKDPQRWLDQLDNYQRLGYKVVANYWPGRPSWWMTDSGWEIPDISATFVETVADHPALLAVYLLHEPYWNGGDGHSTAEQRELYQRVKAIADVPLYSSFSWSAFEQEKFESGVCDYCDSWSYPSKFDEPYDEEKLLRRLEDILNHFNKTVGGTNTKLVWVLQAFESTGSNKEMPTYDEMMRMAETVITYRASSGKQVDAVFWYTWRHGSQYEVTLGDRPDLHGAVLEARNRFVN